MTPSPIHEGATMNTTTIDTTASSTSGSALAFARHYAEMVAAMMVGMAALGASRLVVDRPEGTAVRLAEMALWMTVPMVAWMRVRGHGWRPTVEMAAAMLLPAAGA